VPITLRGFLKVDRIPRKVGVNIGEELRKRVSIVVEKTSAAIVKHALL